MARRDGFTGTDDGQLLERYGHRVAVVEGERTNVKVTFPEDFAPAPPFCKTKWMGLKRGRGVPRREQPPEARLPAEGEDGNGLSDSIRLPFP